MAIDLASLPDAFGSAVQAVRSKVPKELANPQWGIIW